MAPNFADSFIASPLSEINNPILVPTAIFVSHKVDIKNVRSNLPIIIVACT